MKYLFLYLLLMNATAFVIMLIDKRKAIAKQRRIPERVLFSAAIMGGSIGTYLAMEAVRHKTKHKRFTIGVPIMIVIHLLIIILLILLDAQSGQDALNDISTILE